VLICSSYFCAKVFKELFDAVIDERHKGFKATDRHPPPELDANLVCNIPIVSTTTTVASLPYASPSWGSGGALPPLETVNGWSYLLIK